MKGHKLFIDYMTQLLAIPADTQESHKTNNDARCAICDAADKDYQREKIDFCYLDILIKTANKISAAYYNGNGDGYNAGYNNALDIFTK